MQRDKKNIELYHNNVFILFGVCQSYPCKIRLLFRLHLPQKVDEEYFFVDLLTISYFFIIEMEFSIHLLQFLSGAVCFVYCIFLQVLFTNPLSNE